MKPLHDDLGGDGFEGDALAAHRGGAARARAAGERPIDGARRRGCSLSRAGATPTAAGSRDGRCSARCSRCCARAEGYGLVPPAPGAADVRAHGRREPAWRRSGLPLRRRPRLRRARPRCLRRRAAQRARRPRAAGGARAPAAHRALHDAIQQAFGWYDDHLYSFWLDGSFFGSDEVELTTPDAPDAGAGHGRCPARRARPSPRPANRLRVRLRRRLARPPDGPRAGHRRAGRPSPSARASRYAAAAVRGARRLTLMTGERADRDRRLAFAIPPIRRAGRVARPERRGRPRVADRGRAPGAGYRRRECARGWRRDEPAAASDHPRDHRDPDRRRRPARGLGDGARLRGLGYGRHEILHMLAAAMAPQLWGALHDQHEYDLEAHRAALAALPESWERARPSGLGSIRGASHARGRRQEAAQGRTCGAPP